MKEKLLVLNEENIRSKIYIIRGKEVMLDGDLAEIYGYTTKTFNQQVQRNKERFDEDFRFQLTKDEYYEILRSQFVTLELEQGKYSKYLPYVFTEQGIYMLMTVLKGEKAVEQSKMLIRIFKSMKDYLINNNLIEQKYINNLVLDLNSKVKEHENKLDIIFDNFKNHTDKIFFEGQIYDAYSLLLDIFNKAKEELIIIDNYCDKKVLDLICNIGVNTIVISKNLDEKLIKKYQSQYNNLTIIYNDTFHDRFIIINRKELYHLGSSIKDIGKKCFYIGKIEEKEILDNILIRIR